MPIEKNKFYITTSIVYTNAFPHLGFAFESVQADVFARYNRISGKEVFFLTGTDEHGAKISRAAEKEGKSPKEFTDEISGKYKELAKKLNLSNDDFIRTTDQKRHWPSVQKVWLELKEKGDIYKKKYSGLYCVGCEAFITKKDLAKGKCIYHQKEPEVINEENYFFRLSKYQEQIKDAIEKDKIEIIPKSRKNEAISFIGQGLEDVSFSRPRNDLEWGIPVPDDDSQTIYVWCDALVNYISALGYADKGEKFKKFWPANVHFIGKDIQKFHYLFWPGMLLSLGLELPKKIFIHGHITVSGQKMSKSLGNIIDPFALIEKYGTDPVRYFLLREIPPAEDGDFTFEKFEQRYDSDLSKGLGNLVARVVTMAKNSKTENEITKIQIKNQELKNEIEKAKNAGKKSLDNFKFNEALIAIWGLIGFCDKYIEKEKPWENKSRELKAKNEKVIEELLFAVAKISSLLQPFLPETSENILRQIKEKKNSPMFPRLNK